ncbi:HEAT repeat domain-containing protein [Actinoplanes derwentensis]|uniref:HEAT repeat-containing protein n=1 Tax=Actinoplanes derwentensis TaxID=113562 RepID=A0A1H1Z360_9ACTN|nr:HEAT repeat domain-containing protein [Actinoplanes derwentensis]GID81408.1 hypothetical protein Ade03nite_03320 [Actinoplanes derwentensis]SDT28088.1 HEAT repeat-containing protein [Actinoplanes derwentensis]
MTPVSGPVREAIQRGDLDWLTSHLGVEDYPPAVLKLLLRHEDPRLRHWGLNRLDARPLASLADLLPQTLDGPPETSLLLARLHQRLWSHVSPRRRPQWRTADLPPRVQIAWLRAEIVNHPETVHRETVGELLHQAAAGITTADTNRPGALIRELITSGNPILHDTALRLTREALHDALLAPARAREHLLQLLDSPNPDVAVSALRELTEPWSTATPLPRQRLHRFLTAGPRAHAHRPESAGPNGPAGIEAVISAAARHGHGDLLWEIVADEVTPPRARQEAMRALGDLAGREDIPRITGFASTDPLLFGGSAVAGLRAMHRRGLFPSGDDAAAIVDLALADHRISADETAAILFTCRHEAFHALVAEDADGVGWPRRLALLVGLARQGSGDLAIGDVITRLLPAASRPEPFLAAIRALRHQGAEEAVLGALPRAPEAALDALEAIGGQRTVDVLAEGLGLDDPAAGEMVAHLRSVRHRALELVWHLADDPERRRLILGRLDPHDLPGRIVADLGAADPRELALLSAGIDAEKPVQSLLTLARNGDAGTLPVVADVLLRIVADLANGEPAGGDAWAGGEPVVPREVVDALRALGVRLHDRGKLRPFVLREAGTAVEAGHALVATIALDLIDREDLTAKELAVLLGLLREVPYPGTHARVHRLLRHRDRHVRKHVIALLAAESTGGDAEALSASLIRSTTARDAQTVRQALLALGEIGAPWAAPAIAAGLDHPAMNVKKTAAEVLIRAGAPAAVPKMLFWLGHHDNPGLRASLVQALRTILGDAFPATVLAAAEQADHDRRRDLLLGGLDRLLSARAVDALAQQGSPVANSLLTLVATQRIHLGSGTVADLSAQFTAHNITAPADHTAASRTSDDLTVLELGGWDTETACRILNRQPEQLNAQQLARLRPMLADWLRLAAAEPSAYRFVLRFCPEPWSADEITTFARATGTLIAGLCEANLLPILEAVAPTLNAVQTLDIAARIRALPTTAAGYRSPLPLLRRCGAVLTRADVERALAAARLGPDPWLAESAVLRDAFTPFTTTSAAPKPTAGATRGVDKGASRDARETGAEAWRLGLETASRAPETFAAFRARDGHAVPARVRLSTLAEVFPAADPMVREEILDWMEILQPIDAPAWNLTESAERPTSLPRTPQDGDLDQPRSAAQCDRLLADLGAPDTIRRNVAAEALRDWPEPEIRQAVLSAVVRGQADVWITKDLARELTFLDESELRAGSPARIAGMAKTLDAADLHRLLPLLLEWWEHDDSASAEQALRRLPADTLAESLRSRLDAGSWGFLDLLVNRPLVRTVALTETCRRLRADGRGDLADSLVLTDGSLRRTQAAGGESTALAALRERPEPTANPAGPSRDALFALIRTGHGDQVRRALTQLAEAHEDRHHKPDPELEDLFAELLRHPESRVRAHAHRLGRRLLDRAVYLRHTTVLLDDAEPDVVRAAISTLGHAGYEPSIPAIVGLLTHAHVAVRRAATNTLIRFGPATISALRYASGRARPDKRQHYTAVLDRITG